MMVVMNVIILYDVIELHRIYDVLDFIFGINGYKIPNVHL